MFIKYGTIMILYGTLDNSEYKNNGTAAQCSRIYERTHHTVTLIIVNRISHTVC